MSKINNVDQRNEFERTDHIEKKNEQKIVVDKYTEEQPRIILTGKSIVVDCVKNRSPPVTNRFFNLTNVDGYDSAGQKQTDDSSSPDDEESPSLDKAEKASGITKSFPVDIKSTRSRLRGILKYPPGWPRRAFSMSECTSTSSYDHSVSSDGFFGTSLDSPEILFDFDEYGSNCDIFDSVPHQKKQVTFSDKMTATYLFRPGSSILGRRQKNQKKAAKKKERELKKLLSSSPLDGDDETFSDMEKKFTDEIDAVKNAIETQRQTGLIMAYGDDGDDSSCQSSATDISSSSGCDTSDTCSSGDEATPAPGEDGTKNGYVAEETEKCSSKSKRKNRRRRNRKNKLNMKTFLETGGYDSD